jgi:hypothetical protein
VIKRATWFATGMVAGAAGTVVAGRKIRAKAETLKPVNVARSVAGRVKGRVADVADAVREGREAMQAKEAELKAVRDGDPGYGHVVSLPPQQLHRGVRGTPVGWTAHGSSPHSHR